MLTLEDVAYALGTKTYGHVDRLPQLPSDKWWRAISGAAVSQSGETMYQVVERIDVAKDIGTITYGPSPALPELPDDRYWKNAGFVSGKGFKWIIVAKLPQTIVDTSPAKAGDTAHQVMKPQRPVPEGYMWATQSKPTMFSTQAEAQAHMLQPKAWKVILIATEAEIEEIPKPPEEPAPEGKRWEWIRGGGPVPSRWELVSIYAPSPVRAGMFSAFDKIPKWLIPVSIVVSYFLFWKK